MTKLILNTLIGLLIGQIPEVRSANPMLLHVVYTKKNKRSKELDRFINSSKQVSMVTLQVILVDMLFAIQTYMLYTLSKNPSHSRIKGLVQNNSLHFVQWFKHHKQGTYCFIFCPNTQAVLDLTALGHLPEKCMKLQGRLFHWAQVKIQS